MLADVFENFWNISLEIYELDPDYFFNALVSEARNLKKDKSKIKSIYLYWLLLMVEKSIRGGICHANNKYTKYYDRNKDSSYLMYWEDNNL